MSTEDSRSRSLAKKYGFYILSKLREYVDNEGLDRERLPSWIHDTALKVGRVNDTTIFLFRSSSRDEFRGYSEAVSDAQFFLDLPDYTLPGHAASTDIRRDPRSTGMVHLVGNPEEPTEGIFEIGSEKPLFLNAGYVPYHTPVLLNDLIFQWVPDDVPMVSRNIPCLLYVNDADLHDYDRLTEVVIENLESRIHGLHNSEFGDWYEEHTPVGDVPQTDVGRSVIVLGGYDSSRRGEQIPRSIKQELLDIRTYLSSQDYKAHLIEDLYAPAEMSLETLVRGYTATSRFCVLVDREASGHIMEYNIVKQNRIPLAVLRPPEPSTWMIRDDELVDRNDIKSFDFNDSALERVDAATEWAENLLDERADAYSDHYPWR